MFFHLFSVFPWHWAHVSLPILRISMTLSIHCHVSFPVPPLQLCQLCQSHPLVSSQAAVVMSTWFLSHLPFQICHQTPYFPKRAQEKGQLAKAAWVVASVRWGEFSCSKRGLWSSEDNWSISFTWACSFWAHTLIYTGIFLSLGVCVTPVFHDPCIH